VTVEERVKKQCDSWSEMGMWSFHPYYTSERESMVASYRAAQADILREVANHIHYGAAGAVFRKWLRELAEELDANIDPFEFDKKEPK
jgi:hypothetical protein